MGKSAIPTSRRMRGRGVSRSRGNARAKAAGIKRVNRSRERRATGQTAKLEAINRKLRREIAEHRRVEQTMRESQKRFASFMNTAPMNAWMKDHQFRYIYANAAFERYHGLSVRKVLGKTDNELFGPDMARMFLASDRTALRENRLVEFHHAVAGADGETHDWRVLKFPFKDASGKKWVGGLALDVTERMRALRALQKANARVVDVLNHITDGFVEFDAQWRFLELNSYAAKVALRVRKSRASLMGRCLWEEMPELAGSRVDEEFRRAAITQKPATFELYYPAIKGWFEIHAYPSREGMSVYFKEITERKQTEQILRALHGRVLTAQETERRRVARELHDGVNQLLSTAQFRMQGIESAVTGVGGPLLKAIRGTTKILARAVNEVRHISQNLRPSELDHLGLVPAIQNACNTFRERTGIAVHFRYQRPHTPFPQPLKQAVYRIVQEALNNVEKHARATRVVLHWRRRSQMVHLSIRDNGVGFAPAARNRKGSGCGLFNMQERAALAGGALTVSSARGQGTKIEAWLPLKPASGVVGML